MRNRPATVPHADWRARLACVATLLVAGLLAAARADASSFSVNPTQVALSAKLTSALLTIRNETDEPLRFQLSVSAWSQSLTGEMQLTPTSEIIFFPALLALGPKEERKIRVGAVVAPGAVEKTYRLSVNELPPPEKPGQTGIRMLTKMSIPIFLGPAVKKGQATLRELALRSGSFTFRLANAGTVHFTPQSIRVRALDAAGGVVADEKLDPWYILAGTEREYKVAIPKPACSRVASFVVDVQIDRTSLSERLQAPAGACGT
jgi:fimbrial chaperone protein